MSLVLRKLEVKTGAAVERLTELAHRDPRRESYQEFKSSHPAPEE